MFECTSVMMCTQDENYSVAGNSKANKSLQLLVAQISVLRVITALPRLGGCHRLCTPPIAALKYGADDRGRSLVQRDKLL